MSASGWLRGAGLSEPQFPVCESRTMCLPPGGRGGHGDLAGQALSAAPLPTGRRGSRGDVIFRPLLGGAGLVGTELWNEAGTGR